MFIDSFKSNFPVKTSVKHLTGFHSAFSADERVQACREPTKNNQSEEKKIICLSESEDRLRTFDLLAFSLAAGKTLGSLWN